MVASPKPDIVLHTGRSKTAPIISFAKFSPATQSTEIILCPLPALSSPSSDKISSNSPRSKNFSWPSHRRFKTKKSVPTCGTLTSEKYGFFYTVPSTPARAKFEWRHSSRTASAAFLALEGVKESDELNLVRISTAELVDAGRSRNGEW